MKREYTPYEVAKILGLHSDTITAYCRRGQIRGKKKKVFAYTTPLTGIRRHFKEPLEVWVIPASEVRRLKKERGLTMQTIDMSSLSDNAQRQAEQMQEDRPVYARPRGRGYELKQIHFIATNTPQYEAEEARLARDGWMRVEFTA
jgi:hypothetical protein